MTVDTDGFDLSRGITAGILWFGDKGGANINSSDEWIDGTNPLLRYLIKMQRTVKVIDSGKFLSLIYFSFLLTYIAFL